MNRAGETLRSWPDDVDKILWAIEVLDNWRSCHGYPINTFQATLRQKLKGVDSEAIVAQRLKRMPSIIGKLQRFPSMQLARMQDIGGLRAVVSTLKHVRTLEENYRSSRFKHELVASRDYITHPKTSGYRSVHLVYRYTNHRAPQYDGLFIELQIRTRLQHAWATAVETMGTFLNHALKSSEGPDDWLRFFALTGSAFAHLEKMPPVPGYEDLTREDTFQTVVQEANRLDVQQRLLAFSVAAERVHLDKRSGSYHLVILDPKDKTVTVRTYSQGDLQTAAEDYSREERRIEAGELIQAVLVSAGPIDNLRRAYPNFFLDTREFLRQLERIENMVRRGR